MTSALATDLYEITMAAGYFVNRRFELATFELWVRDLPASRSFLIAAGLERALDYLEGLRFARDELAYLRTVPVLAAVPVAFFDDYLAGFRFTGDVWAVPEGIAVFAPEPLVRVTATLPEAQLVETALLSLVLFQTAVASKAARLVEAAGHRAVVEFGARRAHGIDAAMLAGRAAFIGGCVATSDVEAGFRFGIPVSGTMAHSWVMAHADEGESFSRYVELFGEHTVLLIDTYDTVEAARHIVRSGLRPAAVRLDSGNVLELSRLVRRVLDEGGLSATRIFVSGDLDEYRIDALVRAEAPIDAFGVGTALSTSSDAPALGGIYKLVEIQRDGRFVPTMKLSARKRTYPGRKQVWRIRSNGEAVRDVLATATEVGPVGGEPLLRCVMQNGRRIGKAPDLATLRERCLQEVRSLPGDVRRLRDARAYPVEISETLKELTARVERSVSS